jgi:hypothetical protein
MSHLVANALPWPCIEQHTLPDQPRNGGTLTAENALSAVDPEVTRRRVRRSRIAAPALICRNLWNAERRLNSAR